LETSVLFSLKLSLQVAVVATFFVIGVGVFIAYFLAMKNFRGKELVDTFCTLPLVLPPTVTGYYLVVLFGRNGWIGKWLYAWTGWSVMFTWQAAVIASFVVALPLMVKTTRAAIESVDKNLIHASYTLGRSELETAFFITLPLAKKGIIAGMVLSFARALGEFGATLMLAGNIPGKTNTMPLAIYTAVSSGNWNKAHGMVIFFTIISGLFLYIATKYTKRII
jgi:molybdate transport system permease protein